MIKYQIILNVFLRDGRTIKEIVEIDNRESAISTFKYLSELANKNPRELSEWAQENLKHPGNIIGTDGLFGVSYIKILP